MSVAAPLPRHDDDAVREAVRRAAPRFELAALIDLLAHLGVDPADIEYRSHATTTHQPALIRDIEFLDDHPPRVRVTLNIGLLSAPGPLPSYFLKVMGQQRGESLEEFLGFFDQWLLRDLVASLYPERDRRLFADFDETRRRLLQILAPRAPSTVHWLFQRLFPELAPVVRRTVRTRRLRAEGVRLGRSVLGESCTFGGEAHTTTAGLDVYLVAEDAHSATGVPWGIEAAARLRSQALPLLAGSGLLVSVWLLILDKSGYARLSDDRFLGHDPMGATGEPSAATQEATAHAQTILLFSGDIP